ncbi:MAG: SPOR domain-containing protein [Acidobacteria bacterium]|nr:SPOR domain-containing protein [Acidobacteriota bacterium]
MPELTHDAEDAFHEIQLSGKQLVFLFMLTTVVSVAIFLCGVLVGRGVRAERGEDATVASAQSAEAPPSDTAPVAAEPPAPPAEHPLSFNERLRGETPAAETLNKSAAAAEPAPPPVAPDPAPAAAPKQSPPAAAAAAVTASDDPSTAPRPGSWVIQVHALQNREAAGTFVRSLKSKGYPAFLLPPPAGAPQIFRVQIGAYPDRSEAEKVVSRLEKEEQFKPAIKRR